MKTFEKRNDPQIDRASSLTQQHAYRRWPQIVGIETLVPHDIMPGLLALRLHVQDASGTSWIGHGETYYIPTSVAAVIHDFFAPRLLGADALAIESHWRFLYERMIAFAGTGAELRALSAVDLMADATSSCRHLRDGPGTGIPASPGRSRTTGRA
ncbi:MAG: hypothetical protein LW720_21025 [Pirellula sp.]|nr:hypothetical protein [Pirellula sp.]